MLHKDLRRCVTGVMHEHSFMQIVFYYLYLNKYILHLWFEDDRDLIVFRLLREVLFIKEYLINLPDLQNRFNTV